MHYEKEMVFRNNPTLFDTRLTFCVRERKKSVRVTEWVQRLLKLRSRKQKTETLENPNPYEFCIHKEAKKWQTFTHVVVRTTLSFQRSTWRNSKYTKETQATYVCVQLKQRKNYFLTNLNENVKKGKICIHFPLSLMLASCVRGIFWDFRGFFWVNVLCAEGEVTGGCFGKRPERVSGIPEIHMNYANGRSSPLPFFRMVLE